MLVRKSTLRRAQDQYRQETRASALLRGELSEAREEIRVISARIADQNQLVQKLADSEGDRERAEARVQLLGDQLCEVEQKLAEFVKNYQNSLVGRSVIIHTKADGSIEGILTGNDADSMVLSHARYLDPLNETTIVNLDGGQIIPHVNVHWIQELAHAGAPE